MLDWDDTNTSIMNHYGLEIKDDDNEKYLSKIIDYKWDLPHLKKEDYLYEKYLSNTKFYNGEGVRDQYIKYIKEINFRQAEKITIKYENCVDFFSKYYEEHKNAEGYYLSFLKFFDLSLYKIIGSQKNKKPNFDWIPFPTISAIFDYNSYHHQDINIDKESPGKMVDFVSQLIEKIIN